MMSRQGMEILSDLFRDFSNDWVEQFPGCNQNDIERAFLYLIHSSINGEGGPSMSPDLQSRIEKIR